MDSIVKLAMDLQLSHLKKWICSNCQFFLKPETEPHCPYDEKDPNSWCDNFKSVTSSK